MTEQALPLHRWADWYRKIPYGKIGFGYQEDPSDPYHVIPDPEVIVHIEQAFDYIDAGSSLREVCEWLSQKLLKSMVHGTVSNLYKKHRKPFLGGKKTKRKILTGEIVRSKEAIEKQKAKRAITIARKKYTKLDEKYKDKQLKIEDFDDPSKIPTKGTVSNLPHLNPSIPFNRDDDRQVPKASNDISIVFQPNPGPQTDFLSATELEVLYGGSAGGGKSYAMLADPMRYFENPNFVGLLLRRTNDELRQLIWESQKIYPKLWPDAKWQEQKSLWTFPSGAKLWITYLDQDKDVQRYQGQEFCWIGMDELTQYPTPFAYLYLKSRLRSADPQLKKSLCMRACVDEGEVLTSTGWKDIKDINEGEYVYSLLSDGKMALKRVHSSVSFDVKEPLVRVRKKNLYMSMTSDHRVVHGLNHKIERWNDIKNTSVKVIRTASEYSGSTWCGPVSPEFLGWYIAEGSFAKPRKGNYKVVITQNKVYNHEEVRSVMESTGFKVCYSKNGDFQITNKSLWEYVSQFGKSYDKHFPRDFLDNASYDQLNSAFMAYAKGDGHWQSDNSCTLVTTSQTLVDNLCEIGVKLGYKVQVKKIDSLNPDHRDRYNVYFTKNSIYTLVDKNPGLRDDQSFEHYEGKVYCLGVEDTENFILRQKGFVWVSGNTTNPGGPGHHWVKKMFIDPAPPNEAFWGTDIETGEVLRFPENHRDPKKAGKPIFKRRFIPARLSDNPYLAEDGIYESNLLSLPEDQRRKLLEGDWSIVEGAAFAEFSPKHHVCKPFDIPPEWRRFRGADYGYSSPACVLWFAIDPAYDTLYVYRELYGSGMTGQDLARKTLELERGERISYGVLDSSVWHQRGHFGPSIAEEMIAEGCKWRPSDRGQGSRVAGKNRLHELLKVQPVGRSLEERAGIIFFDTCRQIISDIPAIPGDPDGTDDIDSRYSRDHSYDALRYGIMSRPRATSPLDWGMSPQYRYNPADEVFGY